MAATHTDEEQTLIQALDEIAEVTALTLNPSTVRGRRVTMRHMKNALNATGLKYPSQMNNRLRVAKLIDAFKEQLRNGEWGALYSTNQQKYSQMCAIFEEIPIPNLASLMLRNSKVAVMNEAPDKVQGQQGNITVPQVQHIVQQLDDLKEGKAQLIVKGCKTGARKVAMLNLAFKLAASYALRIGSIMDMTSEDINAQEVCYRLQKGAKKGQPTLRATNPLVLEAYTEYMTHFEKPPLQLFKDVSWISGGIKQLMINADIPPVNGRHGIHRFRRAFATYCYSEGIDMVTTSAGLNHSDSQVTERVYLDINAKQQKATMVMDGFADEMLQMQQRLTETEAKLEQMSTGLDLIFSTMNPTTGLGSEYWSKLDENMKATTPHIDPLKLHRAMLDYKDQYNYGNNPAYKKKKVPAPRLELGFGGDFLNCLTTSLNDLEQGNRRNATAVLSTLIKSITSKPSEEVLA